MKILVTVGTTAEYNFVRLLRILDEFCDEGFLKGSDLFVISMDKYKPKNYMVHGVVKGNEFTRLMKESDIVISHAGTGTVTIALKMNKRVILFPRLKEYGEHLNDHQLEICELMKERNYATYATNKPELKDCIRNISTFVPSPFISNNKMFSSIIESYLERIDTSMCKEHQK